MSSFKTGERRDIDVINGKLNEEKDEIVHSVVFPNFKETKNGREPENEMQNVKMEFLIFKREKDLLLSRFLGDLTVEILRGKKESCSTHRGLRVGSDFEEF